MPRKFFNKSKLSYRNTDSDNPIGNLEVKLFGQWDETIRVLQTISPAVKDISVKAQLKVGKEIIRRVKGHLRNQDLGWTPLSSKYQERKAAAGLPTSKILMAYKTYYNSIEVWQKANQHMVFIGVRKGIYTKNLQGKKSKLEVAAIAAAHEFSSGKRLPRRELWNPSIKEMGGVKGIKALYIKHLVAGLKRRGIPIKIYKNFI